MCSVVVFFFLTYFVSIFFFTFFLPKHNATPNELYRSAELTGCHREIQRERTDGQTDSQRERKRETERVRSKRRKSKNKEWGRKINEYTVIDQRQRQTGRKTRADRETNTLLAKSI